MKRLLTALSILALGASTTALACPHQLLVSAYFSGNVHLYDACNGEYLRNLDDTGRLAGAQTSRVGPDGRLYVVAERHNAIRRYDAQTLEYLDTPVQVPAGFDVTGMVFAGANEIWLASYGLHLVRRFSLDSGLARGDVVAAGAGGLTGADNGMVFGPDGALYVPGWDSHNVIRHVNGTTTTFIASGSGGLRNTRGILFTPDAQHILVASEGSHQVLRYRSDGSFRDVLVSNVNTPSGLAYHPDGSLLVGHAGGVNKYDSETGVARGQLAAAAAGQARGVTYVTVLSNNAEIVDESQVGSQYWLSGAAMLDGTILQIDEAYSTNGTHFGSGFDASEIRRKRWGSLRIEFTGCNSASFSWQSSGADSAGFGSGSYPLQRVLDNPATARCLAQGFGQVGDREWLIGSWYGGESRSGEGLMLDMNADGMVFLTWFTFRPGSS